MAIRQVNLNNILNGLQELLETYIRTDPTDLDSGMFVDVKTVSATIDGTDYYGIRCTSELDFAGAIEQPVLDIFKLNDGTLRLKCYYNGVAGSYETHNLRVTSFIDGSAPANKLAYAYATDNGVLINFQWNESASRWGSIMITKGSDGHPFVMLVKGYGNSSIIYDHACFSRVYHFPDASYVDTQFTMFTVDCQTGMCPVTGYGTQVDVTYAPYAYWVQSAPPNVRNAGFSVMKFNEEIMGITNGFWAILDSEAQEVAT